MSALKPVLAALLVTVLAISGLLASPTTARADVTSQADIRRTADAAFEAWNRAFLIRDGRGTYYADTQTSRGSAPTRTFNAALNIGVVQDVYQRTRRPEHRQLANELVAWFVQKEGTYWDFNSWNDDIAWMGLTMMRGYQLSGNRAWLDVAERNWNMAYDRGWSADGGGGIWEDNNEKISRGKCALSNNPMIVLAMNLYQITGKAEYLEKSKRIYAWVRSTLYEPSTGRVNGCGFLRQGFGGPLTVVRSANAYDHGSFVEAANLLYRITGDGGYRDDATRAADYIVNTVPIIHQNQGRGSSYQYRYFRGLSEFCTDLGNCGKYRDYMLRNANVAWNNRDADNLTWNDWTRKTDASNPDAYEMNSMVGLWQQIPDISEMSLPGTFGIQNVASNGYLTIRDGSTANAAAVGQTTNANDPSAVWTFRRRSNDHFEVVNARSGQVLNVVAGTGRAGGLVVQWPAQGDFRQANDQWFPVRHDDGDYSFANRASQVVLDNPAGSTSSATQYHQWTPNDGPPQRFRLIRR